MNDTERCLGLERDLDTLLSDITSEKKMRVFLTGGGGGKLDSLCLRVFWVCTLGWWRGEAWSIFFFKKPLSAFSDLLYSQTIFIIRKSKMMLRQHPYFVSNTHARTRTHTSTHRDKCSHNLFLLLRDIFFFFPDAVKQGTKLCTLEPCVYPACERFCQATGIAVISKNHFFSVLSQFKREIRGLGIFL